eukprot:COSAG05_NODE_2103_length_3555_cov_3.669271_2_plen_77_part_00
MYLAPAGLMSMFYTSTEAQRTDQEWFLVLYCVISWYPPTNATTHPGKAFTPPYSCFCCCCCCCCFLQDVCMRLCYG